ncbi:MAG: hypothetical protein ACYCUG_13255, partial [Acidimicrobiales bacterium]
MPASLHVSVAVLLSVRRDYHAPKDSLWRRWGGRWCDELRALADGLPAFGLRFTSLVVSDAAVIAVADPVPEVDRMRRRAAELQRR